MYYVQFHNVDLGVYCLPDTSIMPISSNEYFMMTANESQSTEGGNQFAQIQGLDQLKRIDFDKTKHSDDNL